MEIKHTQANNIQKILQWLVQTAPFQYRITTHQNGELHIKMQVPEEEKNLIEEIARNRNPIQDIPEEIKKEQ